MDISDFEKWGEKRLRGARVETYELFIIDTMKVKKYYLVANLRSKNGSFGNVQLIGIYSI